MAAIAIFDSGIGGTTVHEAVRERAPWADLVYVADHSFGPYGERTLGEVRARTELLARYLGSSGVSVIAVACNSASAAALHYLRETLPAITFVGMEPAVKPAAEATETQVVGVLATGATFQGELFRSLVGEYGGEVEIVEQACPGLAAAIESGAPVGTLLDQFLPPLVEAGADVVVLGCTHYGLIRDEIHSRLPAGISIIDPAPSVAKRLVDVAHEHGVDLKGSGSTRWWTTALQEHRADGREWETIDVPSDASAAIRVGESTISAVEGDLTRMTVDAITNAANVELRHGGGIALAIAVAGGDAIEEESREWIETYGQLEPGVAALTSAGHMPASYVIHVAGPIYREEQDNETLLTAAVFAALDMASEIEIATVALPAISAGIYGYPPDDAARVIAQSSAAYLSDEESTLRGVRLVGFDHVMTQRFVRALTALD
ncbi:MAG: macro domain-containing protein [Acidimicrobiia bacterium]